MALSKQDQAFYEEKLGLKSFGYLLVATAIIGAIMWPLLLYIQDWSAGQTGKWSLNVAYNLAVMGFLLGTVVAVVMYLAFKFLLQMGWLPSRR
jgi:membrane associated rhomboid family serine protease